MNSGFRDHFSSAAPSYAAHRPTYPKELAQFLASVAPRRNVVWDCGCGSGQLTLLLADEFEHVIATDASSEQIAQATPHPRVEYRIARAESSGLPTASIDLAVAAQAAHWFDLDAYYAEVRRVLAPRGVVALVSYGVAHVDDDLRPVLDPFYSGTLKPHWPVERNHVDDGYRSIPFPFAELPTPSFELRRSWTLPELLGYIRTWSAVIGLVNSGDAAALQRFESDLTGAWGPPARRRPIRWPLALRVGCIDAESPD